MVYKNELGLVIQATWGPTSTQSNQQNAILQSRYQNIFTNAIQTNQQRVHLNSGQTGIGWNWQVLIKIAGRKRKQTNRSAYAYEARTVQGNCIFLGTFSCAAKTALGAAQEALMDALLKARDMGYQRILVLCNSSRLVQVSNLVRAPNWQEQTMVSDILSLQQNGLLCKLLFVPNIVLSHVCYLADQATKMPIHQFWAPMLFDVNSTLM